MDKKYEYFYFPKRLTQDSISEIIQRFNRIFQYRNVRKPDARISFRIVDERKVDLLGILVLFKILEYTVNHQCFSNPEFDLQNYPRLQKVIKQYGFDVILNTLTSSEEIISNIKKLKISHGNDFFVAPIALSATKIAEEIRTNTLNEIIKFFNNEPVSEKILTAFTELYSNYVTHAEENSVSLIAIQGNRNYIEIACADTGVGIIESLKNLYPNHKHIDILRNSIKEGVTSKQGSDHLGQGLWMISNLVKNTGGRLEIYSGDAHLSQKHSKIMVNNAPYWQGTIVYCKVLINAGIKESLLPDNNEIILNIV